MKEIPAHLVDRLPAVSRDKIRSLEATRDEAQAVNQNSSLRLMELGREIRNIEQHRVAVVGDRNVAEKHKLQALTELDAKLSEPVGERTRISARKDIFDARRQRLDGLLQSIAVWLEALPKSVTISEHPRSDRSNKSEVTPDAIEKRRRRIRELVADIKQTDAAPFPSGEAKQKAREQIEQLAELGRPNVYGLIERLDPIEWPEQTLEVQIGLATQKTRDGLAFAAWLDREAFTAAIEREIDASADDAAALSDVQRREKFKILLADALAAEREEETLIQAASFDVDRRADADPRAVLGLSSDLPAPSKRHLFHSRLIVSVDNIPRDDPEPVQSTVPVERTHGKLAIKIHSTVPQPVEFDMATKMRL